MIQSVDRFLPADYAPFDRSAIETSIVARFFEIVRRHRLRNAVESSDGALTYHGLDIASNCVANSVLDHLGVSVEPVVLLFRHGSRYFEAMFGVLKAGKFFASLDAELALDRLTRLASDLGTRLILCSAELHEKARELADALPGCTVLCAETFSTKNLEPPNIEVPADNLAYIIYTSGSTGPPEGVMISHRLALHFAMNQTNAMHIRKEDRSLQVCPLSSAASMGEILPILLNGATLLPWRAKAAGTRRLASWLVEHRVSICTFVPVLFRLLLARLPDDFAFPDVRMVRLSGDRITRGDCLLFARHFGDHCLLRAALGASEANLFCDYFINRDNLPDGQVVAAGYALPDFEILILDEKLDQIENGEVGEIAVKSRYLSEGYWKNEALTAERFRECLDDTLKRLYLSRDLGYLDGDGCLIHVGRKDSRVKIYGKMVTISEVEDVLLEMNGVCEAAVVAACEGTSETFLVAYYVPGSMCVISDEEVREWLVGRFPTEIVPKRIIRLDDLPVTSRNKIDRTRLAQHWQDFEANPAPGAAG